MAAAGTKRATVAPDAPPATWPADAVERRPVAGLVPYARNARTHSDAQVAQIAASIREWGWTTPVLVDEAGGIIAGHGRVMAARTLGIAEVPVMVARGWSDAQKKAYVLADNKLALNAGWDDALLRVELEDLKFQGFDLGLTGFADLELAELLAPVADDVDPAADELTDDVPEPVADPVVRVGDLWLLGGHRLICGDSTDTAVVARLMAGDAAALCFTSPPYGQQRAYTTGGISDWDALMQGVFAVLPMAPDGQVLVNLGLIHRDNEWQAYWQGWSDWMRAEGWRRFGWYVWDQGPGLPGDWNGRLAPSFEFIFHFNRAARQANKIVPSKHAGETLGGGGLRGADGVVIAKTGTGNAIQSHRIPDSVFRIMRHKGGLGDAGSHPAVFPTALPAFVMNAYSGDGDVIYEPFSGSGSTIIAGQQTGRLVRAIELAPAYVDVALRRFRLLYPNVPVVLESDGRSYDAVVFERRQKQEIASC